MASSLIRPRLSRLAFAAMSAVAGLSWANAGRRRADRRHAPALALAARWLWVESAGLPLIRHPEARANGSARSAAQ